MISTISSRYTMVTKHWQYLPFSIVSIGQFVVILVTVETRKKNIQVTINDKLHLPDKYKIQWFLHITHQSINWCTTGRLTPHNIYIKWKKQLDIICVCSVCFTQGSQPVNISTYASCVALVSTILQIDLLGFLSGGATQVVWHSDVRSRYVYYGLFASYLQAPRYTKFTFLHVARCIIGPIGKCTK
jgi:hypothetical protein